MGSIESQASVRFKSERRRKRLPKKDQEKHLLLLHREENKLRRQIRNLGYEPLVPPVQKGYKRLFVLSDDVQQSKQAAFFTELLKKINTVQYSDTKVFTKKKRRGRKIHVSREQQQAALQAWEWEQKKLTEAEAVYFNPVTVWDRAGEPRTVYRFREPWRFVLRAVPNLITEVKIKDNLIEQKVDNIDRYLSFNDRRHRQTRLLRGSAGYRRYKGERPKYENPLRNRPNYALPDESE
jgi:hypothetical protein